MGELFMQKLNGDTTRFFRDGTVEKTNEPLQFDFCDKCSSWKPKDDGRFQEWDGVKILWFCAVCK